MASEEAKFAARADRLAGRQGVAGFMPASARAAQPPRRPISSCRSSWRRPRMA